MAHDNVAEEIAKLAAHTTSEEYSGAFRYRESDRPSHSVSTVTAGQLGHMLDTLNDALIFMRRLEDNPRIDVAKDPAYEPTESTKPIPAYLTRIASEPRLAATYHRTDINRYQQTVLVPDLAAFSNRVHGRLRQWGGKIGETFVLPESIKPLADSYESVIKRYTDLLEKYKDPASSKRDYERIPAAEMEAYAKDYEPVADALFAALKALPTVQVRIGGKDGEVYTLPNTKPANDRLKDSYPTSALFAASIFSQGVADRNKRPGELEYEGRFRTVLGAESLIVDTLQFITDIAKTDAAKPKPFAFPDFDRNAVQNALPHYTRSLQLALAFCRTADCGYDKMYEDMERFIKMADAKPELGKLENTQEAALLLYAVDRGFARAGEEDADLNGKLRKYADQMSTYPNIERMKAALAQDPDFVPTMKKAKERAANPDKKLPGIEKTLDWLQPLVTPAPSAEARREASRPDDNIAL